MKSSNKHSSDFRQTLTRRAVSSNKGLSQLASTRVTKDYSHVLTKSNTLRLFSAKETKMVDYFQQKISMQKNTKGPRVPLKKKGPKIMVQRNLNEQLLLKKSDKMKMIFWNQDPALFSLRPLVVSADFIVNQDNFWQRNEQGRNQENKPAKLLSESLAKEWRQLHKTSFVIWSVRNRASWNRIQLSISTYSLPIHALVLIKRKKNYTVDYSSIARQLDKRGENAIIASSENQSGNHHLGDRHHDECLNIFETVKVNLKDVAVYQSYQGKVPILLGKKAKVMLKRIENDPPGLDCILRYTQQSKRPQSSFQASSSIALSTRYEKLNSARRRPAQVYPCSSIKSFIYFYLAQEKQLEWQEKVEKNLPKEQDWFYEEEQIDSQIQQMKRKYIEDLIASQGRAYQFQGGLSIYNFVGEMFKRNYKLIFEKLVQNMYNKEKKQRKRDKFVDQGQEELDLRVEYYELQ